ncbi:MAG: hypothetical protein IJ895_00885 [Prevotella sp.]|nr:hypothetical protein [Prevotella sp.]
MEAKYNELTADKAMSAREYFWTLRLAILRVDRKQLETSVEVAQYPKTPEIYKVACRIAEAL